MISAKFWKLVERKQKSCLKHVLHLCFWSSHRKDVLKVEGKPAYTDILIELWMYIKHQSRIWWKHFQTHFGRSCNAHLKNWWRGLSRKIQNRWNDVDKGLILRILYPLYLQRAYIVRFLYTLLITESLEKLIKSQTAISLRCCWLINDENRWHFKMW